MKIIRNLILLISILFLSACSNNYKKNENYYNIAMVTDVGGIDDKSFNQSAWEGMKSWGKKNNISEGINGYTYVISKDATEFIPNINYLISGGFKNIFGIGYFLRDTIETSAKNNPNINFIIIDDIIKNVKNVVSVMFKDNESAYLAGVVSGYITKTNKVGFIGGEEGFIVNRFRAGFEKGVNDISKQLNKKVLINSKYTASFKDSVKSKSIAASMYEDGCDIIYQVAGGAGQGVFQEAKLLNESNNKKKVWVIGVDRDQSEDGKYKKKDGTIDNFTLTSTIKAVNIAVEDIANSIKNKKFEGGKILEYNLKNNGVYLKDNNFDENLKKILKNTKEKIIKGLIKVPEEI